MATSDTPWTISFERTVATAGTAVRLHATAGTFVWSFVIKAKAANVGQVYFGGSDVDSSTNDGLDAGESLPFSFPEPVDLNEFYLDVDTNGEGVELYAVKAPTSE